MASCEHCQQQLLAYLYDLLEPHERQETADHLESCATCQEALQLAKQQQGMFAEAVRSHHPDIVFKAPAKATPASTQPTVILTPSAPRRPFLLNRWGVAASILFVLFAGGSALGWTVWQQHSAQREAARERLAKANQELQKSETALKEQKGRTQKEIRAIQEQIDALFTHWQNQEAKTRRAVKQMGQLRITGPQVAQAGAANNYGIQLNRNSDANVKMAAKGIEQKNLPGGVPVQVSAYNQTNNKLLYRKEFNLQENATANFSLPPDLPIHPGDKLALEFQLQDEAGKPIQLRENLNVVYPEYVTHLASDRPIYRPGETLRFRSLTLERFSLKPAQQSFHLLYRIVGPNQAVLFKHEMSSELVAGKDRTPVKGPDGQPVHGVGVGEFTLPAHLADGRYHLIVSEVNERFHEVKRSFHVQKQQPAYFDKELQFHRSAYAAGEQVRVKVRVVPLPGVARGTRNFQLNARAQVDGVLLFQQALAADNEGRASFEFPLPVQILKGVGTVTLDCYDLPDKHETIVRSIPLVVRDLHVEFFPEGGDLIAGVPNRVYFQARTPAGNPAALGGRLTDDRNQLIARVQTMSGEKAPGLGHGQGSFTFTPAANRFYTLHVESPIGIERPFPLPGVKKKGVALSIRPGVVESEIPITLHSTDAARELMIGAYCRGRLLDHAFVKTLPRQPAQVTLKPHAKTGGVYRITVFEKLTKGANVVYRPLAERLIYRKNTAKVDVRIRSDKKTYQPRDRVELTLDAFDEAERPVSTLATVAVVDNKVLQRAGEKTARSLPTYFLLTTEIRNPEDLENADALLGPQPEAAHALDLLLGCQGWRRFAEQEPEKFQRRQVTSKMPVFLANSATVEQFPEAEQKVMEEVDREYVAKAIELQKKLAAKERSEVGVGPAQRWVEQQRGQVQSVANEVSQFDAAMQDIFAFFIQFALGGTLLTLLFIGFFLISVGLRRLSEGRHARTWFTCGLGLLALLFLVSILGTFALMGERIVGFQGRFNHAAVKMAAPPMPMERKEPIKAEPAPKEEADQQQADTETAESKKADAPQDAARPGTAPPAPEQEPQVLNDQVPFFNGNPGRAGGNAEMEERLLRQQGSYQTLLQKHLGRRVQLPPAQDPSIVRVYAHQHTPQKDAGRADDSATLYWDPVLVLDKGRRKIQFDLSGTLTRFEVVVMSHTLDGRLGTNRFEIASKLPFRVEPKMPLEVTHNDQITLPVTITNERAQPASLTLSARTKGLQIMDNPERGINLAANQRKREWFHIQPSLTEGSATVKFLSKTAGNSEALERHVQIVADGFPAAGAVSGVLKNTLEQEITLPASWLPGTLQVKANFYPSPLGELQQSLDTVLREPSEGFAQTVAGNDLNILILNYMKQARQPNLLLEMRARHLLQTGYEKLKSYECTDPKHAGAKRGFDWFGGNAPNDALTAHAVMQLHALDKFLPVDADLLQRNERFLRERVGKIPDDLTRAYVVWALTETGLKNVELEQELARLREQAKQSKDPYFLVLAGLSHLNHKKSPESIALLKKVCALQQKDGRLAGKTESAVGSQGQALAVETTALFVLGWLQANRLGEFELHLQRAYQWLGQQRREGGGFGSAPATVLALKALTAYQQKYPKVQQDGQVQLVSRAQNNQIAGRFEGQSDPMQSLHYSPRTQELLTLTLPATVPLSAGKNMFQLTETNNNSVPYTLSWSCRTAKPANDPKTVVTLATKLHADQPREGETIKLTATIANVSGKKQGMTVAVIGLPAGLALPEDAQQLDRLKSEKLSAWEVRGRDLILYWRELAPKVEIEIELDMICRFPGLYRGAASRAYVYGDSDRKFWAMPLNIRIVEAKQKSER